MICYKDMTFCKYWKECAKGEKCFRALTKDIITDAKKIGIPIYEFIKEPACFEEKNEDER